MSSHGGEKFPELLEVEKKMALEEVQGVEKEVVQTLPALATRIDPVMAEALTHQIKSYGMTFDDVEAGDQVRAHLGNAYAPGEMSTGRDDHHFKKLRLGGNAVFHGRNYYARPAEELKMRVGSPINSETRILAAHAGVESGERDIDPGRVGPDSFALISMA